MTQIAPGSIAERVGLRMRDMIVKINNQPAADITNKEAEASVDKGANNFALVIQRQDYKPHFYYDSQSKFIINNERLQQQ